MHVKIFNLFALLSWLKNNKQENEIKLFAIYEKSKYNLSCENKQVIVIGKLVTYIEIGKLQFVTLIYKVSFLIIRF